MAIAPEQLGIGIRRHFTTAGVHPYDTVTWERRDARITNFRDGTVAFEQLGVEVPSTWSLNATNILAQKYFRGTLGTPERETSLKQVVDRIVDTITAWGVKDGYFVDDEEAGAFSDELKYLLDPPEGGVQLAGVVQHRRRRHAPAGESRASSSSVDDQMESILNWYAEEGMIFKGGSGAGVNLSKIRSSKELLKGGGTASGPVSFMRGADASAGTIKSGGKTRRAAKMVILNVDHPDIQDFIWCKAIEERKARVLRDNGFDMDLDGKDSHSIQYQNANNSVRVTDEFMQAVVDDTDWQLKAVTTGEVVETIPARELFRQMCEATWECADPGMQFDTTINKWHTAHTTGRINGTNPCSEYMHLDNSACNLASLNLLTFLERRRHVRRRRVQGRDRRRVHRPGDPRRQRRLPDGQDRQDVAAVPPARHRLRQPRRAADGPGPRVRQRRRPGLGGGAHRAADRSRATPPRRAPRRAWARSPATRRTASTCSACSACTATRSPRSTRSSCRPSCCRPPRRRGTRPFDLGERTACATARRPCSRPPAPSAC